MHLASLFPSQLESGPHCYRLYLLLESSSFPSAHSNSGYPGSELDEEEEAPKVVELDDRLPLNSYVTPNGHKVVAAKMRMVYTGGR